MNRKWTIITIALAISFLLAFAFGNLYPQEEKAAGENTEKIAKKIVISKDMAIVDGDTFDLEDLEEDLRQVGELDITIVGLDDLDEEGLVTSKRNEIVKFGGDIRVEEYEKIAGSVVVFGGTATIAGAVTEDVVVVGGDLVIEETADIRGSAVCFGGEIIKEQGAKIGDQEVSLGSFPCAITVGPFIGHHGFGDFLEWGVGFFAGIVLLGLLLLLGAGAIFFFPNAFNKVSEGVGENLLKSGLVGLLGEILVVPVLVVVSLVLAVSIIGIPLLFLVIPLAVLGIVSAIFMGYIGTGMFVGGKIGERASWTLSSPYRVMLVGVIALLAFDILAAFVGITSGALWPVQVAFGIVGGIITFLAVTVGFGAVILTRFGTRSIAAVQTVKQEITEE